MNYLKSVARISKEKINLLFKVHNSDVEVKKTVTKRDALLDYYISNFNPSKDDIESFGDYSESTYEFIYTYNGIITDKFSLALSKSMIKQYLFLHFIPANKSGVRKRVSYSSLAKSLNISTVTVKNNMERLVKLGFIWVSKMERGLYDIVIVDEYKNHKIGGKGYITMPLDMLYHLISFDNVNELKVELKKILWCDTKVNFKEANVSFNKDNLLKVLPDYVRPYKKNEILNSDKSMFKFENGTLNYSAYKTKNEILLPIEKNIKSIITDFFKMTNMPFDKFCEENRNNPIMDFKVKMVEILVLDDLTGLAIQYNLDLVMKSLIDIYTHFGGYNKNDIIKMGAFVRDWIEKYISINKIVI